MDFEVFISYANKDKSIATAVCHTLEENQIKCWIAPRDVLPGVAYAEVIVKAIKNSELMVLVFSESANLSPHVRRELERAVSNSIPILPFKVEEVKLTPEMEYYIGSTHWLDAMTPPLEKHLKKLTHYVKGILKASESTKKYEKTQLYRDNKDEIISSEVRLYEEREAIPSYDIEIESGVDLQKLLKIFENQTIYDSSRDKFNIFLDKNQEVPEEFKIVYDYEYECVINEDKRNFETALQNIDMAFKELDSMNKIKISKLNDEYYGIKARIYIRKGILNRMRGGKNPEFYIESIKSFKNALKVIEKIESQKEQNYYLVLSYIGLADVNRVSSKFDKSELYLTKAKPIIRKLKKEPKERKAILCLGYYYNQSGLYTLQKWTKNPEVYEFLQNSKNEHIDSLIYFLKLRQIRWIYKSLIDLCGTLYRMNNDPDDVEIMIKFIEAFKSHHQFIAFQNTHNILANYAKFLILKDDKGSLEKAQKIIKESIKRSEEQKQNRVFGTELVLFAEIELLLDKFEEGLSHLYKGLSIINDYNQVKDIVILELEVFLNKLKIKGIYSEEQYIKIKEKIIQTSVTN